MLMQSFKTMLEYKGDFILLMVTTIVGQMSGLFFIYLGFYDGNMEIVQLEFLIEAVRSDNDFDIIFFI